MQTLLRISDSLVSPIWMAWKPPHMSTTRWHKSCLLDLLEQSNDHHSQYLKTIFSKNEEYGLLNRLDQETSWLVYFATSHEVRNQYKNQQWLHRINKYYIADVVGIVKSLFWRIQSPIAHHPDDSQRMMLWPQWQSCTTYYEVVSYNYQTNTTTLSLTITKWVRHQIRVHLLSIGHPIIWDSLYITKRLRKSYNKYMVDYHDEYMHLWSVGVSTTLD